MRVMLAAHMDEVGLMVVGHDSDGFLQVRSVGGIDARLLPGVLLWVGPERIPGVIGAKPIHLVQQEESRKVAKIEQLVVDVGAKSKDEAKALAPLGTKNRIQTLMVKGKTPSYTARPTIVSPLNTANSSPA